MRLKELLVKLLEYLREHKDSKCVCDVLDRMYVEMFISFGEMNVLQNYIQQEMNSEVVDKAISTGELSIFISEIENQIEALQG